MKKAVVFLADGFEDIEALAPVDILRRGGVDLTIAGVTGMQVVSYYNVKIMADKDVKALGSTKVLIDKLTEAGGVSKLQLMQELFGMSKEELLKELTKKTGGE